MSPLRHKLLLVLGVLLLLDSLSSIYLSLAVLGGKLGEESRLPSSPDNNRVQLPSSARAGANLAVVPHDDDAQPTTPSKRRFAYAFVIGGCDPSHPSYRYYLYNVMVATRLLLQCNSKADVVALVQISSHSNETVLPPQDQQWLNALQIRTYYIPKVERSESFYRTTLDKFRVLSLEDYDRVLFLDGDVVPLTNLDYLMEMSSNGTLHDVIVVQGNGSPANGGFFIVTPNATDLKAIQDLIQYRQTDARTLPGPHYFDPYRGWGHPLDHWQSLRRSGSNWTFHNPHGCQGLLYMWIRFVRKRFTLCLRKGSVQQWNVGMDGKAHVMATLEGFLLNRSPEPLIQLGGHQHPPYSQYAHMTSHRKPWLLGPGENTNTTRATAAAAAGLMDSVRQLWFHHLMQLNEELNMGLDFDHWQAASPSLGFHPHPKDVLTEPVDLLTPLYQA